FQAEAGIRDPLVTGVQTCALPILTSMADYFVLATATNDRQAQAMADAVEMALKAAGRRPSSIEGYAAAAWILLDYGDVIFHVFQIGRASCRERAVRPVAGREERH